LLRFKQRFQELGWTEGRNVTFEHRYTDGNPERTRAAAKELSAYNLFLRPGEAASTITAL
jgi:hypothetical protein